MPTYLYLIHPYRHGFFDRPTEGESAIMEEHFAYLSRGVEAGTVLLAGPCLDDTFGLVVFHSDNDDTASSFMFNDPSVKKNVMVAELHPFRLSLAAKFLKEN